MKDTIKTTVERTRQYWYIDGFGEMLTGLVFLLLGLVSFAAGIVKPSLGTAVFIGIGYPVVILLGTFGGRKLVKSLKEKVTFPRTGYVEYIRPQRTSRMKRGVTAGLVAITVSIGSMIIAKGMDVFWVTFGTGLMIAAFITYLAVQIPLNRFYLLALWTIIIGLTAAWMPVEESFQTAILLGGCGLGWLASGALSLLQYLRGTRPAAPEMGE